MTTPPIRKPSKRPPRLLVYGRNKKGKTHFCATAPDVLILDPEDGTAEETAADPDVWPVTQWSDLQDAFSFIKKGGVSPTTGKPYRWICVDGLTRIHAMALRFVTSQAEERNLDRKPGLVMQKDYGSANELLKGMVLNFHGLPQGIIFTAQERVEQNGDPDILDEDDGAPDTLYLPDLPQGSRNNVNAIVDVIARVYTMRTTETKKFKARNGEIVERDVDVLQYRLWLAPHIKFDTGYRSSLKNVPDSILNPTVTGLVATLRGKADGRQSENS